MDDFERLYMRSGDAQFEARHRARCRCGAVRYEVCADPVNAKICHCTHCQRRHGAPMQWAAIFRKRDVRVTAGADRLRFYNSEADASERILPCRIDCGRCGTPVADEGRRMWLAFPALFEFGDPPSIPEGFRPRCHIFYGARVLDIADALPKWTGHENRSARLG